MLPQGKANNLFQRQHEKRAALERYRSKSNEKNYVSLKGTFDGMKRNDIDIDAVQNKKKERKKQDQLAISCLTNRKKSQLYRGRRNVGHKLHSRNCRVEV